MAVSDVEKQPRHSCGKFMGWDRALQMWICCPCAEAEYWSEARAIQNDHRIEAMRAL